ncbi:MAG: nicotinate-nucleotide adenylyltransferase [Bacillus sp. (in: firmicutes)]
MRKVGILGGTFDPPHIGHAIIASGVKDALGLDEVRFMPNNQPPHKKKTDRVTNEQRVEMVRQTVSHHDGFGIELAEMGHEGTSYTYDTMKRLNEREPESEFYFIIGADMIEYLPKWHRVDELAEIVQFVGVQRPGYNTETEYPVMIVDVPQVYLSSSVIREKVRKQESITYLVVSEVEKYIKEHSLYES